MEEMTNLIPANAVAGPANAHTAIDTLAWLIEDAFAGDPEHSLLANLRDLRDEDWTALPPGGGCTIVSLRIGNPAALVQGLAQPKTIADLPL